ncbi:bicyclomycin resistance protein [Xylariales sp. PMI_506]|nr:bicyclomycin resistance protein [Xylariales sp. PMI_506]
MSAINDALVCAAPDIVSPLGPPRLVDLEPRTAVIGENEKITEQALEIPIGESDPDAILVDYEENDPENPLNCTSTDSISVFATMRITPTAPQILQQFSSHSSFDQTLLVTIWELGEGIGPFFIAPLSERFGRLPVFHLGNPLALCCLAGCALSVSIPMLIAFRFLTSCCLSILTLGPAIVGDLFDAEFTGLSMALVISPQIIADFISAVAGAYVAETLGWRWSVWLAAIVLGFFSCLLLTVLRETYAVVILKRKAARLVECADGKKYRSKHQARVDASTMLESVARPMQILVKSPILMLTQGYMTVAYALVSLVIATLTPSLESTYPGVFSHGSIGLTFLSFAIGNTIALIFYTFTSDRYVSHERQKKGDAFKPETRLVHILLAAIGLPLAFLIYGWKLASHVQYIVPLIGTSIAGVSMTISTIPVETYVVDIYEIHGASAIAAGVVIRAFAGAFLPLIGPALYESIGHGWGNTVLALIAAAFILPLIALMRYGDWFRGKERFGSSGR